RPIKLKLRVELIVFQYLRVGYFPDTFYIFFNSELIKLPNISYPLSPKCRPSFFIPREIMLKSSASIIAWHKLA
ncbi:hypothetical protein, partial [Lactobacillus helveticus]|uniref:hypothetical protein n=1 Tax=Lactobacillus helveticus TaxID=1587 RepID=UPI003F584BD2